MGSQTKVTSEVISRYTSGGGGGGGVAKCRLSSQAIFLHDYFRSYDHAIFGHKIFLILTRNG